MSTELERLKRLLPSVIKKGLQGTVVEGVGKKKAQRRHTRVMGRGRVVTAGQGPPKSPPRMTRHQQSTMSRAKRGELSMFEKAGYLAAGLPLPRRIRKSRLQEEVLEVCRHYMRTEGLPFPKVARPPHPLPRRDLRKGEPRPSRMIHRAQHTTEYVRGCEHCQRREYAYFRAHPDARPKVP